MSSFDTSDILANAISQNELAEIKRIAAEEPDVLLKSRTSFSLLHIAAVAGK